MQYWPAPHPVRVASGREDTGAAAQLPQGSGSPFVYRKEGRLGFIETSAGHMRTLSVRNSLAVAAGPCGCHKVTHIDPSDSPHAQTSGAVEHPQRCPVSAFESVTADARKPAGGTSARSRLPGPPHQGGLASWSGSGLW